jgi:hypothetical protein
MAVHPPATRVQQDRAPAAIATGAVDGTPTAGGSGTRTILLPLPTTRTTRCPCSSPRSSTSVWQASKIRNPTKPSIVTNAKSLGCTESRAADRSASNCRCESPSVGDSFETRGRRTYSAGECSSTQRVPLKHAAALSAFDDAGAPYPAAAVGGHGDGGIGRKTVVPAGLASGRTVCPDDDVAAVGELLAALWHTRDQWWTVTTWRAVISLLYPTATALVAVVAMPGRGVTNSAHAESSAAR